MTTASLRVSNECVREDTPNTKMWEISHAQPGVRHHKSSVTARLADLQVGEMSHAKWVFGVGIQFGRGGYCGCYVAAVEGSALRSM